LTNLSIRFLGGTREVGASGIQIKYNGKSLLLDYGIRLRSDEKLPLEVDRSKVVGVAISHAHIDHSGAVAYLYKGNKNLEIIATAPTVDYFRMLMRDMLNLSKNSLPFRFKDVKECIRKSEAIGYGITYSIDDIDVTLYDAGHIPGSSSILIEVAGKKIWYTGDINTVDTRLLKGAKNIVSDADIIITESTYATKEHPPREEVEREFVESLIDCIERGGIALVPAFSVGRAQEVLTILKAYNFEYPVVLDGMAREASEITLRYPNYLKDPKTLRKALGMAKWIRHESERKEAIIEPKVIVSPAGMLQGGSANYYMKHIYSDERSGIYLVGYQVEGTTGYRLLKEKKVRIGRKMKNVKAEVKSFELSSHSDHKNLLKIFDKINKDAIIFTVHGEPESCISFAEELKSLGFNAIAPNSGDYYNIV